MRFPNKPRVLKEHVIGNYMIKYLKYISIIQWVKWVLKTPKKANNVEGGCYW